MVTSYVIFAISWVFTVRNSVVVLPPGDAGYSMLQSRCFYAYKKIIITAALC